MKLASRRLGQACRGFLRRNDTSEGSSNLQRTDLLLRGCAAVAASACWMADFMHEFLAQPAPVRFFFFWIREACFEDMWLNMAFHVPAEPAFVLEASAESLASTCPGQFSLRCMAGLYVEIAVLLSGFASWPACARVEGKRSCLRLSKSRIGQAFFEAGKSGWDCSPGCYAIYPH